MASKNKTSRQKGSANKNQKTNSPNSLKANSRTKDIPRKTPPKGMSQARYDKLVAESQAPYKGLRKFMYAAFGASGAVGGFVFFTKILAGRDLAASLPNLALQLGVVALMVFLFRWEDRNQEDG
ncbi:hypothetical protein S7335_3468 [Synechococcus sp. PCC 7335]|uniref:DUF3493 domain-containing protein n=1 Tax=Synechococcus sp. (strain ATCC 29403 / PCC 7335) TaxID=91464 RepID=UPI00017EE04F|nr:hypothetical protein S7335_3468 [Synechococcus sp. PCC 7335]